MRVVVGLVAVWAVGLASSTPVPGDDGQVMSESKWEQSVHDKVQALSFEEISQVPHGPQYTKCREELDLAGELSDSDEQRVRQCVMAALLSLSEMDKKLHLPPDPASYQAHAWDVMTHRNVPVFSAQASTQTAAEKYVQCTQRRPALTDAFLAMQQVLTAWWPFRMDDPCAKYKAMAERVGDVPQDEDAKMRDWGEGEHGEELKAVQ